MPQRSGIDLLKLIKSRGRSLPVIMFGDMGDRPLAEASPD